MSAGRNATETWLIAHQATAEFLRFAASVHTVEEAVSVSGQPAGRITKSIAMVTASGALVIAVVPAASRASTERVRKVLGIAARPRLATAEETEQRLGQQLGGVSPFDARDATVIVDPQVLAQDWVLTGGGDALSLVKIDIAELTRLVSYTEARVRK